MAHLVDWIVARSLANIPPKYIANNNHSNGKFKGVALYRNSNTVIS